MPPGAALSRRLLVFACDTKLKCAYAQVPFYASVNPAPIAIKVTDDAMTTDGAVGPPTIPPRTWASTILHSIAQSAPRPR